MSFLTKPLFLILSAAALTDLTACVPSSAAPINSDSSARIYSRRRLNAPANDINGAKMNLTGGWNHLLPGDLTATTNDSPFLVKDMWIVLDETGTASIEGACWIEVMVKNGNYGPTSEIDPVFKPNYKGYQISRFVANTKPGTTNMMFVRNPYGTNPSPTAQAGGNLEVVKNAPSGQWQVNINGVKALTINDASCRKFTGGFSNLQNVLYTPTGGSKMQWGIESNDTTNTFTNGTSATLQVKQGMGGYVTPSNTAVYESSDGNFGWYTTYSNGTMTMNRP